MSAGFNHSMCLSKSGKVYTWGYNGRGLLGRLKGFEEHLPIEVFGEFQGKIPNFDEIIQRGD